MGLDDNAERNGQGSGEQPGISKYDEEFDDIFGETEQRQTDAPGLSGSQNEYLLYKNGANADAIGKEHKGDGSQLSSSVEVRSGTPASDYTFR
ncbi:unnamed protein product [Phytophthora lilii]|uniref:Unnamed protein product n=1 Tax=Phytophthora lilii TaxID=2077276 RepID=A0A9W7CPW4_9STRA|nr:unnamed protein product [Phytophthora lilii]